MKRVASGEWRVARKGFIAAALILVAAVAATAQGVRYDNQLLSARGLPVAGASVAVCTISASTATTPCSPTISIWSDRAETVTLANPTTTSGLGNYGFFAPPGSYLVQIYGASVTTQVYTITLPCDPSATVACAVSAVPTLPAQTANTVLAGPASGAAAAPTFRASVSADIPAANLAAGGNGGVTGTLPQTSGGTGATSLAGANIPVQSGTITTGDCVKWASGTSVADSGTTGCVGLQVAAPSAPSVTVNGTAGTTTYTYFVVAHDNTGGSTLVSASGSTTTGNATLSATNFNAITWTAVTGAVSYDVLKTNTATSLGLNLACCSLNDTGQATAAYTAPSSNTTAYATQTQPAMANGRYLAGEPKPSDAIQFVSVNGNDSNDGLSWGTAKLTLSAAIAALPASGGWVYMGGGNYTWSANQFATAPRGVTVRFIGKSVITVSATQVLPRSTAILCPDVFPLDQASVATDAVVFNSTAASNAFQVDAATTIRGCAFQAGGAGAGAGADFYVTANGNRWEHNVFDGKLYAINLDQSFNSNACNIYVESFLFNLFQSTSDNIHFTGPSVGSCQPGGGDVAIGNWFQKNAAGETGGSGINIPTSSGWGAGLIAGNIFTNNTASALVLGGTSGATVSGNDIEGINTAGTYAIDAGSATQTGITNNNIGASLNGINLGGQTGVWAASNSFSSVTHPYFYASVDLGLTGNAARTGVYGSNLAVGSASANFLATLNASSLTTNRTYTFTDAPGALVAETTSTSAATNFGTAITTTTVLTAPSNYAQIDLISFNMVQTLAGVGCSAATNSATLTVTGQPPGGGSPTVGSALTLSITGNGAFPTVANLAQTTYAFPVGGAGVISYSTTSTLASTGCTTVPQYTVYAKVVY